MTTTKITTRNYRTYLLNQAAKTGDQALANLAKMATPATLKNLYNVGYAIATEARADDLFINDISNTKGMHGAPKKSATETAVNALYKR